jgi:hypothetical protein
MDALTAFNEWISLRFDFRVTVDGTDVSTEVVKIEAPEWEG